MIENRLFEELEKSTRTGCWEYNLEDQRLWWSKQTYDIHNVPHEEEINVVSAIDFYHNDDRHKIQELFEKCITTGEEFRDKFRIITRDKKIKYVESYGKPFHKNNKIVTVFGTFQDISKEVYLIHKQRTASFELKKNIEILDQAFILATTDERGKIEYVNNKFEEISGYSKDELIGNDHRILNSGKHSKQFFMNMWEKIKSGHSWEGLICNKNKTGLEYWVQTFIFPRFNNSTERKIIGYIAVRYDVTDKVSLEEDLRAEQEKLQMASQLAAIGEMSAGIAHEIANPLAIISGNKMLLEKKDVEEEKYSKALRNIDLGVTRISKIVKGLHHLAQKSRSSEHQLHNVGEIVNYTFEFCLEALKSKHISITFENNCENPLIYCDEVKVSQIILNLINNARDAVEGLPEKWIKVKLDKCDNYLRVSVIDSGNGIPESIADKILSDFFTTKDIGKGTGLGLSLVKKYVKEHDGVLNIVNDSSNTHFEVKFPIKV